MLRKSWLACSSSIALAGLLALAACNQNQNPFTAAKTPNPDQAPPPLAALPLSTAPAEPIAPAPDTTALPAAAPVPRGRLQRPQDAYAFSERAYAMNHGFGDAPPDYAFDYGGTRPWAWRSDDGYERMVEPTSAGDRDYYYEPGSDQPFLVRDGDYSYGYEGGTLAVVYDRGGRPLADYDAERLRDRASRAFWRARELHDAAARERHFGVARDNWRDRRPQLQDDRQRWAQAQQQNPDWRAYHDQFGQAEQQHWTDERFRREAQASRVDRTVLGDQQAAARDAEAARLAGAAAMQLAQARAEQQRRADAQHQADLDRQRQQFQQEQQQAAQQAQAAQADSQRMTQLKAQEEAARQAQLAARQKGDQQGALQAQAQAQALAQQQARLDAEHKAATDAQARRIEALKTQQAQQQAQAEAAKTQADALARQRADLALKQQAQQQAAEKARLQAQALAQRQNGQQARVEMLKQQQTAAEAQAQAASLQRQQAQLHAEELAKQRDAARAQSQAQAVADHQTKLQAFMAQAKAAHEAHAAAAADARAKARKDEVKTDSPTKPQ